MIRNGVRVLEDKTKENIRYKRRKKQWIFFVSLLFNDIETFQFNDKTNKNAYLLLDFFFVFLFGQIGRRKEKKIIINTSSNLLNERIDFDMPKSHLCVCVYVHRRRIGIEYRKEKNWIQITK